MNKLEISLKGFVYEKNKSPMMVISVGPDMCLVKNMDTKETTLEKTSDMQKKLADFLTSRPYCDVV